jgi:hypothetical protein
MCITLASILLVGKPEKKRQLRNFKRRWEDTIKIDLEIKWDAVD